MGGGPDSWPGEPDMRRRVDARPVLSVWAYDSPMGAAAGVVRLRDLRERHALTLHDAITVTWIPRAPRPRIGNLRREAVGPTGPGSTLGRLLDLLIATPGVGVDDVARALSDSAVDRSFLQGIKDHVVPGSSALLALTSDVDLDVVRPVIERGLARGDVVMRYVRLPAGAHRSLRSEIEEAERDAGLSGS